MTKSVNLMVLLSRLGALGECGSCGEVVEWSIVDGDGRMSSRDDVRGIVDAALCVNDTPIDGIFLGSGSAIFVGFDDEVMGSNVCKKVDGGGCC